MSSRKLPDHIEAMMTDAKRYIDKEVWTPLERMNADVLLSSMSKTIGGYRYWDGSTMRQRERFSAARLALAKRVLDQCG